MASESGLARLVKKQGNTAPHASIGCLLALVALGCSDKAAHQDPAPRGERPPSVYTVNYPLAYFAERLAPKGVDVVFPLPPDVDPAFWKPAPSAIGQYQRGGLILLNGAGYARWARYATLPTSRMIVTADGCRDTFLPTGETVAHQHGPGGEHAHEGTAFTTWLDMRLALCQASRVHDALVQLAPAQSGAIDAKLVALDHDLTQLDERLRSAAKAWGHQPVLASHPVYQYLADAYGLRIESVHFEPDEALTSKDLQALASLLERHPAKLMLWEARPLPATEQLLRAHGITTVVFDPAAQPPTDGDFLTVMTDNIKRLACATGAEACR
jgi:zinc transport system substrate-binding protein